MPKVPQADNRSIPRDQDRESLLVTALGAELGADRRAILVDVAYLPAADRENRLKLVLSPPAAAQLSRALKKTVKEYLSHTPDTS